MRLISISIEGYRRFRTRATLQIDSRLVALLGPNEAGKTSILRALLSMNDNSPFSEDGPTQDVSRATTSPQQPLSISAKFLVEENDLYLINQITEAKNLRWITLSKNVEGKKFYNFSPAIKRDKTVRRSFQTFAHKYMSKKSLSKDFPDLEKSLSEIAGIVDRIINKNEEDFGKDDILSLNLFQSTIDNEKHPSLYENLSTLIEHESKINPSAAVWRILNNKVPLFVLFNDEDRDLKTTHDISTPYRDKNPIAISKALQNLVSTAELDLQALYNAIQKGDIGKIHTLTSNANEKLEKKMSSAWSQSSVYVRLHLDRTILSVLVGSSKVGWENLSERSDGLRQFVSLFSFLSQNKNLDQDIILLIDEAENHLHYDAQADLIQMLGKQKLARQIIYTTHSLGCLPEDLGLGLRFVQPTGDGGESSTIQNKFWSNGSTGLSPILVGMGAATMAFLPVRYCVLTEGPVDSLLLPSLIREATGREIVGYQISPGLSSCDLDQISVIQNDGSRVAFLIDGDDGGKRLAAKLKRAKIPEKRIISLSSLIGAECVVEDLIDSETYSAAINEEFRRSGRDFVITQSDLPNFLRPNFVDTWCMQKNIQPPKKIDVAYKILDKIYDSNLVKREYKDFIIKLDQNLVSLFEFDAINS